MKTCQYCGRKATTLQPLKVWRGRRIVVLQGCTPCKTYQSENRAVLGLSPEPEVSDRGPQG